MWGPRAGEQCILTNEELAGNKPGVPCLLQRRLIEGFVRGKSHVSTDEQFDKNNKTIKTEQRDPSKREAQSTTCRHIRGRGGEFYFHMTTTQCGWKVFLLPRVDRKFPFLLKSTPSHGRIRNG